MTDLYIATPTQADYDALMRLAEAAGYVWRSGYKPTEKCNFDNYEREVVVWMQENAILEYRYRSYYEGNQGVTIETIPNLANIKAIWKVSRENRNAFTMKHRLPPHYKSARKLYVICDEYSETYTTEENEIYKSLAVEYKPKESEVMPEKVKLPKFMCDWLDQHKEEFCGYPITDVSKLNRERDTVGDVGAWLICDTTNQWLLIDALRYGYEAEPEPLWGIKVGNCYVRSCEDELIELTKSLPLARVYRKGSVERMVKALGFGEVVDLNKEGKAYD
ncbi:DUF1642 domain-containing protein [Latilactobacillus curvatus]|uniref:DUF1642 domain-containing protein n=1 Tax=Latilactobacillus curvatus TaxID=28038 RepID=UPI0011BB8AC7|nr:DUF1642 domain-containing protein [Latilactobacillus curvatus]QEA48372.1 DUF1642 domain-containing protein [Latilactobacillus curvatus]